MSQEPAQEPRPDVSQFTDSELLEELTRRGYEVYRWNDEGCTWDDLPQWAQ